MSIVTLSDYWHEPEAVLHDWFGVPWCACGKGDKHIAITDDQRTLARALVTERNVAAKGGNGTGKSWIAGAMGATYSILHPQSKALWTAPTMRQAELLSWGELKRHMANWQWRDIPAGGTLLESEWKFDEGWYALAFTTKDVGANEAKARAKGFHALDQLAVLDESNGVPDSIHDAVDATWQGARARIWHLWNPTSAHDRAAQFWSRCLPAGRITLSAERTVDWQERHQPLPGMPDRRWLDDYRKRYFGTTFWCAAVTGEFPDDSLEQVVVPRSWLERVKNLLSEPSIADRTQVAIGVDTGWGGKAETVFAARVGRRIAELAAYPAMKNVPDAAGRLMALADKYGGKGVPLAIDCLGNAGSGVHDLCREHGYNVVAVYGGARPEGIPDEYAGVTAWAWFELRDRVRRTCEALDRGDLMGVEISLLDDPVLFDQLSTRRWTVKSDRRMVLEDKVELAKRGFDSPDRADAVAYSLIPVLAVPPRIIQVTADEIAPELAYQERIGDYGGDL